MTTRTWTVLELLRTTSGYLAERDLPSPRLAAERLLAQVLSCRRVDLYLASENPVGPTDLETYRDLVREYRRGVPLAYVVGEVEFMGLDFQVDRNTLIPRPETEILVDAVLKRMGDVGAHSNLLELGSGCGALAVALAARRPRLTVWTTEASPGAARLARDNARRHDVESRVHVLVMDRFEALHTDVTGGFDWLVSNPPYVTTAEMAGLPPDVAQHEPTLALHGGPDGLDFHRYLCNRGLQFLALGGTLAVEMGAGQAPGVRELFAGAGLADVNVLRDYAGHDRVVLGTKS